MRLTELDPAFVRYETRVETRQVVDGDPDTWHARGCPTRPVTGPVHYTRRGVPFAEAQGVRFLCPACFEKNGGRRGTHAVDVTFKDRGAADDQGSHTDVGEPSRWEVTGDSFENLSLSPSIDGGCWHGYVTNGEIR